MPQRTVEQVGNEPVLQFREQIAEAVTVVLQERISWCVSSENYHKLGYHFTLSRKSHVLLPRQLTCSEFSPFVVSISQRCQRSGETSEMSYDCNLQPSGRPRKRRRRHRCFLENVHNAGLSGVVRVIGACLIVRIVKTGRCRLRKQLLGFWSNIAQVQNERRH